MEKLLDAMESFCAENGLEAEDFGESPAALLGPLALMDDGCLFWEVLSNRLSARRAESKAESEEIGLS